MQIRDANIMRLIERIGEHFRANISNRYIRPGLLQLPLEKQIWDLLEKLTEKVEQYRYQGFDLYELYHQVLAAAQFVAVTRKEMVPALRSRLGGGGSGDADKVLRDMAVANFASNLQVFADLVNELYIKLVELDKNAAKGKKPLYLTIPEIQDIGRMLIGH